MGRKQEGTRPEISDRVKALVERAKARHIPSQAAPKPVATPARSSTPPPAQAKLLETPPASVPADSPAPMSVTESPLVTQPIKRLRTLASEIGSAAPSEVPSLPSFNASSYKNAPPHHSDSASTIAFDMAKLKLGLLPN